MTLILTPSERVLTILRSRGQIGVIAHMGCAGMWGCGVIAHMRGFGVCTPAHMGAQGCIWRSNMGVQSARI